MKKHRLSSGTQQHLLDFPKVSLKYVLNLNVFYFWIGQLMYLTIRTAYLYMTTNAKNYDIVLFKGLARFGAYNLNVVDVSLLWVRLLVVFGINIFMLIMSYIGAKKFGAWIVKWMLIVLVIFNLGVVTYW